MKSIVFFLILITNISYAQELLGDGNKFLDHFARHSLSGDGNTIAVKDNVFQGPLQDVNVYDYDGTQWNQRINSNNPTSIIGFAFDLSTDSSTLIIDLSVPPNNEPGAKVYEWDGTQWQQKGNDIIVTGNQNDYRQVFVDQNGDIFTLITSDINNNFAINSFEWNGNSWQQRGNTFNTSELSSISLSKNQNRFVGVKILDQSGSFTDYLFEVYEFSGNSWNQLGSDITQNDFLNNTPFFSLATFNNAADTFAIGCSSCFDFNSNGGAVVVYTFNGSQWIQKGNKILPAFAGNNLGADLAFNALGDRLFVGEPGCDCFGQDSGRGVLYEFNNSSNTWNEIASVNGEFAGNRAGSFVDINQSGNTISLGAINNIPQVRVFDVSTLGIAENQLADFSIYPNPAQDLVNIKLNKNGQLNIYSLKGEKVLSNISLQSGNNTIDISDLASGVYLIKSISDQATLTDKLIIR